MAVEMPPLDKVYEFLACKPTVNKKVIEPLSFLDGIRHHLTQFGLFVHAVFIHARLPVAVTVAILGVLFVNLFF